METWRWEPETDDVAPSVWLRFGFWLSHVPMQRFSEFWQLIGECLRSTGRVAFVDDAYRTADELIQGEGSEVIERRLTDGRAFKAVKVPHTPAQLQEQLRRLGWDIQVRSLVHPFFWASGARAR